jgi:hypothetical protein
MASAIICHGAYGKPGENWYGWLGKELERRGWKVCVPSFPTPEGQSLRNWLNVLEGYDAHLGRDAIIVGHSISCALVLKKIESLDVPIKAAFLVASFLGDVGIEKFDRINRSFFEKGFDWEKIKSNCGHFEVFHGDDDPYLPLSRGREVAGNLGVGLKIVIGAGHFNESAGFTKFPLLLGRIKSVF